MRAGRERGRHRRARWILLAMLAGFIGVLFLLRVALGAAARKEVQAIRDRRLPTSESELDYWYKNVPAGENAALLFLEAAREHVFPPKGMDPDESKEQIRPGEPLPEKLAEAVATYLSKNELTLEKIHEAAEVARSRYPVDCTRGFATLLPHLAPVKEMAQLLKWAAIQKSAEGKPDEAVRALLDGFALGASLEPEPLFISQLVRIACLSIVLKGLEPVINENSLTDQQLAALNGALLRAEENGKKSMLRGFIGERAMGIPVFNFGYKQFSSLDQITPTNYDLEDALKISVFVLRRMAGMHQSDLRFYLDAMGSLERASELDFPEMLPAVRKIHEGIEKEFSEHRWKYLISGMLLPSLDKAAQKEGLLAARLRCARMAVAIERFRLRNQGKLPRLDQLTPDFMNVPPTDPIDGKPIEYRLSEGKGYQILAAGATELSNEGRKPANREDIGFTVVR